MREYNPRTIEPKWQDVWLINREFEPKEDFNLPKKYILSMFPYPSGAIHMGHVRNYCIGDAMARFFRKNGFNVLHPIGWDAFGMPAENAAIKHKLHPKKWTYENIENMKKELFALGISFGTDSEFATCDPLYSRWEQEFFVKMWDSGLIYRKEALLNWCPNDQTVLANEQVVDGKCWRCDTEVVQKNMNQYYIRITDYAEELLQGLDSLEGKWPSQVITMQKNWIGKSSGVELEFRLCDDIGVDSLRVFTTRVDTIYGVSYCALAPEHKIVNLILEKSILTQEQIQKIVSMQNTNARDRAVSKKEGVYLGIDVIHPLSGERIPLWVANFVMVEYGCGAIMGVPAHDERDFEFAQTYSIPLKPVIASSSYPFCSDGVLINSGDFDGLDSSVARERIASKFEQIGIGKSVTNYKLRDWGISRQRYWGTPIPMVFCQKCGLIPERNLPVLLPDDVNIDGEGNPLQKHPSWKNCKCPNCGDDATRESDTMDTFMESSWYFLRYTTPRDKREQVVFDKDYLKYWLGVDEYIGGIEHAILHLLYARFFTKVLNTLGYVDLVEPFENLLTQGMVLKDGRKMSKSLGNIVEPSDIIQKYGADSARLFVLFAAPPTKDLEWNDNALEGAYRFIKRLWDGSSNVGKIDSLPKIDSKVLSKKEKYARKKVYEALKKSDDIFCKKQSGYPFNTLIAGCMEALNALNEQENADVWSEGYFVLLNVLEPIIPHITHELSLEYFGLKNLTRLNVDEDALKDDVVNIVISINGKKRAQIEVAKDCEENSILLLAKESVSKWLDGVDIQKEIVVPNKLVNFVLK